MRQPVVDGAIAEIKQCQFDPFSIVGFIVGKSISCKQTNGTEMLISEAAAFVVNATWMGRVTADGKRVFHAIAPGAALTCSSETLGAKPGLVGTSCTEKGCTGAPSPLASPWLQLFVAKNPQFELSNFTRAEFDTLAKAGWQQYASLIETADPDLIKFRDAGGKMVTFHGLADNIIHPGATEEYYNAVAGIVPKVHDFYRYFETPALGHCWGGPSGQPNNLFQQLCNWVENGTALERTPIKLNASDGKVHSRIFCPYPQKAQFDASCGDAAVAECWSCSGSDELPISNSTQPN
ncbi:hypothetical protein EsH8_X_000697 [Colletotrichum jinshuiense]